MQQAGSGIDGSTTKDGVDFKKYTAVRMDSPSFTMKVH
jgi:hypothetical protein